MKANRSRVAESCLMALCQSVCSSTSTAVLNELSNGSNGLPSRRSIDPKAYTSSYTFALDYAVVNYLRKYEGGADKTALTAKAILGFRETESAVGITNRKLRYGSASRGVEGIISDARRKIIHILGSEKNDFSFPYQEMAEACEWGKGASYSIKGEDVRLDKKILEPKLSVTKRALKYARAYLTWDTSWVSARMGYPCGPCSLLPSEFNIVEGGRFDTVDKDIGSRRSIDIQPTLNLFLQKGIGLMIRRRLKRCGINLDDQGRNQMLASVAQKMGLATLDLAKASDSVSSELVQLLLPREWFEVLNDLRTHSIEIEGRFERLEKFSSMGNGFTFELESLIFYALCWAVVRREGNDSSSSIAVYGDDIIVHQSHSSRVIEALTEVGFQVNLEKSFTDGRFFESCGKHFFDGVDVTPPFQKEVVGDLSGALRCANRIMRWALRLGNQQYLDGIALPAWRIAKDAAEFYHKINMAERASRIQKIRKPFNRRKGIKASAPKAIPLPWQPWYVETDDALLLPEHHNVDIHGIGYVNVYVQRSIKIPANEYALLATSLRRGCVVESPFNGFVTLRGRTGKSYERRRLERRYASVPQWRDENYDVLIIT